MLDASLLDYLAVTWLLACWIGFERIADRPPLRERSVHVAMARYRRMWMRNMLRRDARMVDTMIQSSLQQGTAFFASTAVLLIGGLATLLAASEDTAESVRQIPLMAEVSPALWSLKLLLLMLIFVYAFFKFAWCYRLFTYCAIMMGAAPVHTAIGPVEESFVARASRLHALAGEHFNSGLRAYFFALGALAWMVHPLLLLVSSCYVTYVLYRREFRSRTHDLLFAGVHEDEANNAA